MTECLPVSGFRRQPGCDEWADTGRERTNVGADGAGGWCRAGGPGMANAGLFVYPLKLCGRW